jgi:quercetin dioxygenase-like cupin family protein
MMRPPGRSADIVRLRFETSEDFHALAKKGRASQPYAWSNGPGDRYAVHQHGYTKLLMCAAGSITFLIGPDATAVELNPGDGFILPAGTPHAAVVGPGGCTCLEGHRNEW